MKGCKEFISEQVRKQKGTFENDWGNQIAEFGVYGKTIHTFVYTADTKKRYVHIYYSAAKAAGERARLEESIQEMQSYLKRFQDTEHEFGPSFHKYFHLHYNKDTGHFVYGGPKLQVIRDELDLCGYFAIISSEKMDAKKAITLYKNRDASEKVFRADKSYLGNNCLRVASEEAASNKIFIGFIALIIRCKLYTALKDKAAEMLNVFIDLNKSFDCVISNNDSMALGAVEACKANGISVPILGVDATTDGCAAIASGDMAFTVYQSATGQGEAAVKVAVSLANHQSASSSGLDVSEDGKYVWVPFEPVDASNVASYQ